MSERYREAFERSDPIQLIVDERRSSNPEVRSKYAQTFSFVVRFYEDKANEDEIRYATSCSDILCFACRLSDWQTRKRYM
jgi:hypothetical protein